MRLIVTDERDRPAPVKPVPPHPGAEPFFGEERKVIAKLKAGTSEEGRTLPLRAKYPPIDWRPGRYELRARFRHEDRDAISEADTIHVTLKHIDEAKSSRVS